MPILLLVAWFCMPRFAALSSFDADARAVRSLLEAFETAWNSGDVDRMVAAYTDPHVDVNAPGQVLTREQTRAALAALEPGKHYRIHIESDEVIVEGDRAFQRGTFVLTPTGASAAGSEGVVTKGYLEILARGEDGRWRVFWSMDGPVSR